MQSAFIIRNMDSTPEPQSPKMAATAKGDIGSVQIVHLGCHPSRMITIPYVLNTGNRYV